MLPREKNNYFIKSDSRVSSAKTYSLNRDGWMMERESKESQLCCLEAMYPLNFILK